jgi:asparagine synthase (glutamine-hydrolysing)
MCAIVGKLNFDRNEPADPAILDRMMRMVVHRGPDGGGKFCRGPIALGHRRLSIIDLSTGDQPMCNEDGTIWLVYNGEIYNFPALRADLEARGHRFKSSSDTEVIVHLYEELGQDCVKQLQGMFAFALWDERKQHLFLARDRVGIKPLYYVNNGNALLFASEIKALLADSSVRREANLRAIDRFLTYYYLPGRETLLEGVYKLEPGHSLTVKDGGIKTRQYWDLEFPDSPVSTSFEEAREALQALLRKSVKDHMISDVPVGVLLSGGVDSTGVLRYAVEHSGKPINTFTIGFGGSDFPDERIYARIAAKKYGTLHHEISLSAAEFADFLPRYIRHMEEPVCEPPGVSLYFLSKGAAESGVKVLLSGEGGDEAFGGYLKYRNYLALESLKARFGSAKGLLSWGMKRIGGVTGKKGMERYANLVHQTPSDYYYSCKSNSQTYFNRNKHSLYRSGLIFAPASGQSAFPTRCLFERMKGQPLLHQLLYIDTKTWLPDDLLVKADKMTMATSVELRVPLLDHRILEFAASLPASFKVKGFSTKRILKEALRDSVPHEILSRKKAGFPLPYERWLNTELRELVVDTLLSGDSSISCYFEKPALRELVENQNGNFHNAKEIFSLLVLELWHKEFMMSGASLPPIGPMEKEPQFVI